MINAFIQVICLFVTIGLQGIIDVLHQESELQQN